MKKKFWVGSVLCLSLVVWGCGEDKIVKSEPDIVQLKDDVIDWDVEEVAGMHESSPETLDCYFAESVLKNGESQLFYAQESVPLGKKCGHTAQARVCENGVLSGNVEFKFEKCTEGGIAAVDNTESDAPEPIVRNEAVKRNYIKKVVPVPAAKKCEMGEVVLNEGESRFFYKRSEVESFMRCEDFSIERECVNGVLDGDDFYNEIECHVKEVIVPIPRGGCIWGGVILEDGESALFYSKSEVASPFNCDRYALERYCSRGRLSGSPSYSHTSCKD